VWGPAPALKVPQSAPPEQHPYLVAAAPADGRTQAELPQRHMEPAVAVEVALQAQQATAAAAVQRADIVKG
jgi:hypothetical protein